MITYEEMQYLDAFSETGRLTDVAERFHISQSTITRCMKKLEEEFGAALFTRTKNKIELNENGRLAVDEVRSLLRHYDGMIHRIRAYDRANHTISVGSAAAVQIPELIRRLSSLYPASTISTEQKKPDELLCGLKAGLYSLIILPYEPLDPSLSSVKIGEEHLMFYLPENHRLAGRSSLAMAEMNGENMLLYANIGFWYDITVAKMPDSHFLIQNELYSMEELTANSVLPCFVTDLSYQSEQDRGRRVRIPITDPEVNVSYYLTCRRENEGAFSALLSERV